MKKETILIIVLVTAILIFNYLLFSFVNNSFNGRLWSFDSRALFAFIECIIFYIGVVGIGAASFDKK